jgi:hypothetical protein
LFFFLSFVDQYSKWSSLDMKLHKLGLQFGRTSAMCVWPLRAKCLNGCKRYSSLFGSSTACKRTLNCLMRMYIYTQILYSKGVHVRAESCTIIEFTMPLVNPWVWLSLVPSTHRFFACQVCEPVNNEYFEER